MDYAILLLIKEEGIGAFGVAGGEHGADGDIAQGDGLVLIVVAVNLKILIFVTFGENVLMLILQHR